MLQLKTEILFFAAFANNLLGERKKIYKNVHLWWFIQGHALVIHPANDQMYASHWAYKLKFIMS